MNEFIRVVGDDIHYTTRKTQCWISLHSVARVYPVSAVESNGQLWRSTHDHARAKLVSYIILDVNGEKFSCAAPEELQKLGIETAEAKKRTIGFLYEKEGDEGTAIDLPE